MDFGMKSVGAAIILGAASAAFVYVRSLIQKTHDLNKKILDEEIQKDIDKVKSEVEGEDIVKLVDNSNIRLRRRRRK